MLQIVEMASFYADACALFKKNEGSENRSEADASVLAKITKLQDPSELTVEAVVHCFGHLSPALAAQLAAAWGAPLDRRKMIRVNDAHHAIRAEHGKGRVCDHRWDEWAAAPAASYADFVCVGKQKKLSARCAECAPPKAAAAATPGGAAPLLPQQHNDTQATQPQQEEPTVTPAGEVGNGAAADAAAGATAAAAEHDAGADVAAVAAEWAGTAAAPGSPVAVLQHPAVG